MRLSHASAFTKESLKVILAALSSGRSSLGCTLPLAAWRAPCAGARWVVEPQHQTAAAAGMQSDGGASGGELVRKYRRAKQLIAAQAAEIERLRARLAAVDASTSIAATGCQQDPASPGTAAPAAAAAAAGGCSTPPSLARYAQVVAALRDDNAELAAAAAAESARAMQLQAALAAERARCAGLQDALGAARASEAAHQAAAAEALAAAAAAEAALVEARGALACADANAAAQARTWPGPATNTCAANSAAASMATAAVGLGRAAGSPCRSAGSGGGSHRGSCGDSSSPEPADKPVQASWQQLIGADSPEAAGGMNPGGAARGVCGMQRLVAPAQQPLQGTRQVVEPACATAPREQPAWEPDAWPDAIAGSPSQHDECRSRSGLAGSICASPRAATVDDSDAPLGRGSPDRAGPAGKGCTWLVKPEGLPLPMRAGSPHGERAAAPAPTAAAAATTAASSAAEGASAPPNDMRSLLTEAAGQLEQCEALQERLQRVLSTGRLAGTCTVSGRCGGRQKGQEAAEDWLTLVSNLRGGVSASIGKLSQLQQALQANRQQAPAASSLHSRHPAPGSGGTSCTAGTAPAQPGLGSPGMARQMGELQARLGRIQSRLSAGSWMQSALQSAAASRAGTRGSGASGSCCADSGGAESACSGGSHVVSESSTAAKQPRGPTAASAAQPGAPIQHTRAACAQKWQPPAAVAHPDVAASYALQHARRLAAVASSPRPQSQ